MKDFSLALCFIFLMAHILAGGHAADFGIYDGCPSYCHLFYIFFHAGWLHLLCNCMCCLEMGFFAHSCKWYCWMISILIAWVCPAFSDVPVVGFSGVLYALSGFSCCMSHRKMRPLIILAAMTMFQFLSGGIAVLLHLSCFFTAMAIGFIIMPVIDSK